jgi:hypothetical protein
MKRLVVVLPRLLAVVVMAVSGCYLLIYLYRWEWNRALITGLVFVAAELAVIGAHLAQRLSTIEARLAESTAGSSSASAVPPPPGGPTRSPTEPAFAWLRADRTAVFVPVLLGAGAVVSALTYLIERIAATTHRQSVDARTRTLLGSGRDRAIEQHGRWRSLLRWAGASLAGVAIAVVGIDLLADATQSRPDPLRPGTTTIELHVEQRKGRTDGMSIAQALGVACRSTVPDRYRIVDQQPGLDGVVTLVVEPVLGEHDQRKLVGCLQDATLDLVRADVLQVAHQPAR